MKIAVTVCDCSAVVHAGGDPHRETATIELTNNQIPEILRRYVRSKKTGLTSVQLSLVVEETWQHTRDEPEFTANYFRALNNESPEQKIESLFWALTNGATIPEMLAWTAAQKGEPLTGGNANG